MKRNTHIILLILVVCFFVACTQKQTPFSALPKEKKQEIYDYFFLAHHESIQNTLPIPDEEKEGQDWENISFSDSGKLFFQKELQERFPDVIFSDYESFIESLFPE